MHCANINRPSPHLLPYCRYLFFHKMTFRSSISNFPNRHHNKTFRCSWCGVVQLQIICSSYRELKSQHYCFWYLFLIKVTSLKLWLSPCMVFNGFWYLLNPRMIQQNPVYSTNKTDRHDITEILLTVAINAITLTLKLGKLLIMLV